jgi:hypothetical protein
VVIARKGGPPANVHKLYDQLTPDTMLSRNECAEALTQHGYPITEKTLATRVTRGGGPKYFIFNKKARYRWGTAFAWAQAAMSPEVQLSSELRREPEAQLSNHAEV